MSINKLTETEKAYIAGMLDADGCVGIQRKKSLSNAYDYDYGIRVIITNSDYPLICWLKKVVGAGCSYESKQSYKANWNLVHRWQITNDKCRSFLSEILPYMIVKKDRASICLKMPHQGHLGKTRSSNDYKIQQDIFKKLKQLNVRGRKEI